MGKNNQGVIPMAKNNQMYKFYSEMTKGYREHISAMFEHGVRCWMECEPENPFEEDSEAYGLFFKIYQSFIIWNRKGVDSNISRRRMLAAASDLCKLNPKRPYKFNKEEDAEDRKIAEEEQKAAEEQAKEEARLEAERKAAEEAAIKEAEEEEKDMIHVFGVLPKTKEPKISRLKNLFKR